MRRLASLVFLCAACGSTRAPPNFTQTFDGVFIFPKDAVISGRANGLLIVKAQDGHIVLTVEMTSGSVRTPKKTLTSLHSNFKGSIETSSRDCFEATLENDDLTTIIKGCRGREDIQAELSVSFLGIKKTAVATFRVVSPVDRYFQVDD